MLCIRLIILLNTIKHLFKGVVVCRKNILYRSNASNCISDLLWKIFPFCWKIHYSILFSFSNLWITNVDTWTCLKASIVFTQATKLQWCVKRGWSVFAYRPHDWEPRVMGGLCTAAYGVWFAYGLRGRAFVQGSFLKTEYARSAYPHKQRASCMVGRDCKVC